jgi:hypothetical protein
MTPRGLVDRLLSPAGFALALLLFLLPFVTVSCDVSTAGVVEQAVSAPPAPDTGTFTATYTGLDLLTGGGPDIAATSVGPDGRPQVEHADEDTSAQIEQYVGQLGSPQPLAIVAALVVLGAMLAGLFAPLRLRVPISAAAALAAIVLLTVQAVLLAPTRVRDSEVAGAVRAMLVGSPRSRPAIGFYLIVVVLLAVLARQFVLARRPVVPDPDEHGWPPEQVPAFSPPDG